MTKPVNQSVVKQPQKITDLSSALKSGLPVVVDLGADWCPACKMLKPVVEKLQKDLQGKVVFLTLDIDHNQELAAKYRVNLIPTLIIYDKKGQLKDLSTGYQSEEQIIGKLKKLELLSNGPK